MLELIVLGKIPGTEAQLSFTVVLLIWAGLILATALVLRTVRFKKFAKSYLRTLGLFFMLVSKRR